MRVPGGRLWHFARPRAYGTPPLCPLSGAARPLRARGGDAGDPGNHPNNQPIKNNPKTNPEKPTPKPTQKNHPIRPVHYRLRRIYKCDVVRYGSSFQPRFFFRLESALFLPLFVRALSPPSHIQMRRRAIGCVRSARAVNRRLYPRIL